MPPKRWAKPARGSAADATDALLDYVCAEIHSNNCLGLEEEEIQGMAGELATSSTRKEVFDWANTLMMGEAFAAEIIKRRDDFGPPFEGESAAVPAEVVTGAAALAASRPAQPAHDAASQSTGKGKTLSTKKAKRTNMSLAQLHREKADDPAAALKSGHFECGCFGTIHNLRGNCANCGRIICEQEANDNCYYCDLEPARCINYEIAVQEGKVSEAAVELNKENYDQAIARRDTLLDYARNRSKRTKVIDDQSESLFTPQSAWMSPDERQKKQQSLAEQERRRKVEKMHHVTGAYQVHVDFVGKNIALGSLSADAGQGTKAGTADGNNSNAGSSEGVCDPIGDDDDGGFGDARAEPLPSLMQKIWYSPDGSLVEEAKKAQKKEVANTEGMDGANKPLSSQKPVKRFEEVSRRVQQNYFEDDVAVFAEEAREGQKSELLFSLQNLIDTEDAESGPVTGADGASNATTAAASPPVHSNAEFAIRYAPTPLMLARDDGVCMSMHQPWASLLAAGIKTHEGRVWSTNYRGRLWIHAASAAAHDVEETEKHYSQFMSPGQTFPKHYPTRVLLGYVYVTECMDLETYEAAFPAEVRQERSPFSFICTEPKELPFPLPMDGNHKLFSLDHKVLVAAKKQLKEIS